MRPKRSLGQNFFINQNLAKHIASKVLESKPNAILEIGPGKGFFTQIFVQNNMKVICIEKDSVLAAKLQDFLPEIEIYMQDVFEVDIGKILPQVENITCFGSLPYNAAKRIISKLLTYEQLQDYYFIVQKEVAEKYTHKQKTSLLSLKTQLYADCKILLNISPHNFTPKPNVDSSLIHFKKHSKYKDIPDLENFAQYLNVAFKQPRKKLKNNIDKSYKIDKILHTNTLDNRAEDLGLEDHLEIWKMLK